MRKSRLGMLNVKAEGIVDPFEQNAPSKQIPVPAPKKEKKEKLNYTNLVTARELEIADGIKLVFSVSKTSEGNPHVDIRTHITSEKYTGMTKKGINFDVESLEEFRNILEELDEELESKGI